MAQRCPICKTRLWTDPLLTPARLRCPRCDAEFKPTVPWKYFRILLFVVVALGLILVFLLARGNIAPLLFLVGLAAILWFLPRLINLELIGPELSPDGVLDPRQMELELDDLNLDERYEELQEKRQFRRLILLLLAIALVILIALLFFNGF